MSDDVPGWFREAVLYYSEWNYKSNKRIAREKWRIDRNQDNSIYAHYNSVATELMHSFKDGLSSIDAHAPFEDDLRFLSRIKHLIDEKIDSPECKLIAGELIETRELFLEDFKESFEAIKEQGISDVQGQEKQSGSKSDRRCRLLTAKILETFDDPLNIPHGDITKKLRPWYEYEFNLGESSFKTDLGNLRKKGVYSSQSKTRG